MDKSGLYCTLKRAGIIGSAFIVIFLISFGVTLGILHFIRSSESESSNLRRLVGSVKVDAVQGRSVQYDGDHEHSPILKESLEKTLSKCLASLSLVKFEVKAVEEDELARIFQVNNRGAVVQWNALVSDNLASKSAAEIMKNCHEDIVFDPDSVKVGLAELRTERTLESFEDFLLDTEEEFDLRNIELSTISVPKFQSDDVICPPLQILESGSVEPISCTVGDYVFVGLSCQFSCDANLTIFGDDAITCLATGSWDNIPPVCSRYCYRLSNVENGAVYPYFCTTMDFIPPGTLCSYYCDATYALEGGSLSCSSSGVWDGVTPICKKTCPSSNSPKYGIVYPTACRERRQRVGNICSFDCNKGYTLSGPPSTVCDVGGRWSSSQPSCRKACPLLQMPSHGAIYPSSCAVGFGGNEQVMEGIVCVYSCDNGYARIGPEILLCGEGGVWLGREAECKRTCEQLSLPPLITANPQSCLDSGVTEGARCDLQCVGSTVMFGDVTSTVCLETGIWSDMDALCYHVCTSLPAIYNRILLPSSCMDEQVKEGTECTFQCIRGFHKYGDEIITCQENRQWSGSLGFCYRRCDKLPAIVSGFVRPEECTTDGLLAGKYCEFFCDGGHALNGLRALTCLDDGTWAGNVPTCQPVGHFTIEQQQSGGTICLVADFDTLQVRKEDISSCNKSSGPHWWMVTAAGNLKSVILDKCMSPTPVVGGLVQLADCTSNASQLWEWRNAGNWTAIILMNEELFLSSGYSSVQSITLSDTEDDKSSWDVVFSNTSLAVFEERFGGSCPKLKNSSVVVEPAECVLSRYIKSGIVCRFSCLPGFNLVGDEARECIDGHWSNSYPTCRRACPALEDPLNGSVNSSCKADMLDQDTKCTYSCNATYSLRGEKEVICLAHGEWSDPEPECLEMCLGFGIIRHGSLIPKSCSGEYGVRGDECNLECSPPYVASSNETAVCQSNHTWTKNLTCLRSCHLIVHPDVIVDCDTEDIREGSVCTYQCNQTKLFIHELPAHNETVARICLDTGIFNTTTPRCGITCPVLLSPQRGSIEPRNCFLHGVPEGQICSVKCTYGYQFEGVAPDLVCLNNGSWSHTNFSCEPMAQFTLFNDEVPSQICARTDVSETGSHLMKDDLNYYMCYALVPGTTWMWVGDMLRNILAELCIAVEDLNSPRFSLIVFKQCNENDTSQQWYCEHEYFLRLISAPFYMNAGSNDNSFVLAKRYDQFTMSEYIWKSSEGGYGDPVGGACMMKPKRCPPVGSIVNARVEPASCLSDDQDEDFECEISCNSGFKLDKLPASRLSLHCTSYGAWRSNETLAPGTLPVECHSTCPPLSDPIGGEVEPASCRNETAVFGTACHYKCDYWHELNGVDVVVCGKTGTWTHGQPYCGTKCTHDKMIPGDHPSSPYTEYPSVTGCTERSIYAFSVDEGVTCYYDCLGGMHKLVGSSNRTCLTNQSLSGINPTCEFPTTTVVNLLNCPSPPGSPAHTFTCYLNQSVPSTERLCANYTCPDDHILVGEQHIHCDVSDYSWLPAPLCKRKCDDISFNCRSMYAGQVCYMKCFFGESFSHGYGIYLCQENGQWNDTVAACIDVDNFFMQVDVDDRSRIHCLLPFKKNPPYFNAELIVESCRGEIRSRWMWKYVNHIMHLASGLCLTAVSIEHGARLYLSQCEYADHLQQWDCSTNPEKPYRLFLKNHPAVLLGTSRALFDHTKHFYLAFTVDPFMLEESNMMTTDWKFVDGSVTSTLCALRNDGLTCPPLETVAPEDVSFSPSVCIEEWSPEGRACSWFCDFGEPASSPTTVHCENGAWTSLTFLCTHYCPALQEPAHGNITNCNSTRAREGTTCNLECDEGTFPISGTARLCQWDESWSGDEFLCAYPCDPLTPPFHATISPLNCLSIDPRPSYGKQCTYSCDEGFYLSVEESSRTCLENGSWSGEEPLCTQMCPPLPHISHGSVTPSTCVLSPIQSGATCTITCENRYLVHSSNIRECQSDGTWLPEISGSSLCQLQCERFLEPENSDVVCSFDDEEVGWTESFYALGTKCRILCNLEYTIRGSGVRVCRENGSWSGEDSYCYPVKQFLIFLSKNLADGTERKACLSGSSSVVWSSDCDPENPFHRWSWYTDFLLKNSGTGECIMVANPYPGQRLQMALCNGTDERQQWSCESDTEEWFLRAHNEDLYPDFGYAVSSTEYYSDDDEKNIKMTICSWRTEETGGICTPLPIPSNGKLFPNLCGSSLNNITAGLSCSFHCNVGFKLDTGISVLTCQSNGLWSSPSPNCEAFCYPLTMMPNMVIHPESCVSTASDLTALDEHGILPGGVCTVSCEDGYVIHGNVSEVVLTCLQTGRWSSAQEKCNKICPSITQMHHMKAYPETCSTTEQSQGTICTLQCDPGYIMDVSNNCQDVFSNQSEPVQNCTVYDESQLDLVQELTKLCMGDGSWSGDPVYCVSVCQPIIPPRNGYVSPSTCTESLLREGMVCSFYCDEDFMTTDITIRTCDRGNWVIDYSLLPDGGDHNEAVKMIADFPSCDRFCMFDVYNDSSTYRTPAVCNQERVPVGIVCTASCASEFILIGESKTTCFVDGTWDETPGKCIKKCTALTPIINGDLFPFACSSASLGSGAICTFTCLNQYALIGSAVTTCNSTGQWSSPPPICERKCKSLPKLYNGQATPPLTCYGEHIVVNDTCEFACNDGFELEGANIAKCMDDGEWDKQLPRCIRHCSPFSVLNATVKCSRDNYIWGTVCKVICDRGLAPSYLAEVSCNGVGDWSPEIPRCVETGVPMYIMQSLDKRNICLKETIDGLVIQTPKQECLTAATDDIKSFQWRWLENFNIQNIATGRCLAAHYVRDDEPIVTSPCNVDDVLQLWECSVRNPFRLLLKDTEFSPSTYRKGSDKVVLQRWSDAHSYFSTLSVVTTTFSSLCTRRPGGSCPPLTDIPGGAVEPAEDCKVASVEEGVRCLYQCLDEKSVLIGDPVTQCLGNGIWLSPPPKCVVRCPLLIDSLPPHTYYADPDCVFDEPQHGLTCTAECLSGYEMIGNPNRTCMESGSWSDQVFQCRKICPTIYAILNGTVSPHPCSSGVCRFLCDPGHMVDGSEEIECGEDGEWDGETPICIRDSQFQIISLTEYGAPMCVSAAVEANTKAKTCDEKDASQFFKWDVVSLRLVNARSGLCLTASNSRQGKVVLEFCDLLKKTQLWNCGSVPHWESDGLRIEANGVIHFLNLGTNSGQQDLDLKTRYLPSSRWYAKNYYRKGTVCSMRNIRQCSPFIAPPYSRIVTPSCQIQESMTAGSVCKVECELGFVLGSIDEGRCLDEGKWSTLPICTGTEICDNLPAFSSGRVIPSRCVTDGVYSGETCTYQCDEEFLLVGDQFVTCLNNRTWSSEPPLCVQMCAPLYTLSNGMVSPPECQGFNVLIGMECQFSCDDGFTLLGSNTRTCDGDGFWSGEDTTCERLCPVLAEVVNGKIYPDVCTDEMSHEGYVCMFSCNSGYALQGPSTLSCYGSKWSGIPPTCIKLDACPKPISYDCDMNVKYSGLFTGSHIVSGTTVTVSCGSSCTLSIGPSVRTCGDDGQWDQGTPSCKKKCPPVNVPFGLLLTPTNCNYDWQDIGSLCTGSCFGNLTGLVSQVVECQESGIWSKKFQKCEMSGSDNSVSKVFMIRQYYPGENHICLQADDEKRMVKTVAAEKCSETELSQLWRWHGGNGYKQIESISSKLCWSPQFSEDGMFLSLKECSDRDTDQVFSCGNIESQESVLRLSTGNLHLATFASSDTVQLTSSMLEGNFEWEAHLVGGGDEDPFKMAEMMSPANSLCRSVCGRELTSHNGYILSPAYPSNYIRNVICDWKISLPNRKITLWLHDVSLHQSQVSSNGHCIGDHLLILDGDEIAQDESNVLGQICGNHQENVGPFIGMHGTMKIRFFSDDSITSTGFSATWDSEELPPSLPNCGIQQIGRKVGRIVGGSEVELGEVPWFASLLSLQRVAYVCGATLISSQFFVTASDCFVPMDTGGIKSYAIGLDAGYSRLLFNLIPELVHSKAKLSVTSDDGATLVQVVDVIFDKGLTDGAAMALVKVAVKLSVGNSAACLPPPYYESPTHHMGRVERVRDYCIVAGWNSDKKGGERELHIIDLPIISDRDCDDVSLKLFGLTINMTSTVCAAHFDGSRLSLCEGDQGSGIVCRWNRNYYIVGVALNFQLSYCRELNIPKYFARISIYHDWIRDTINGV